MPRFVKGKLNSKERVARAKSYRVRGYKGFIDPFPLGFGTLPEKMVYKALSDRRISFLYLNDVRFVFPEISFDKTFQADFVIPGLMIIIEVNGAFWHSKDATIEGDAFKYAVYEQAGYKVLAWWDFDIIADLNALFRADPQLAQYNVVQGAGSSEIAPTARTKTDTSKGIRTLNYKRGQRLQYRKPAIKVKTRKRKGVQEYSVYGK